MGWPVVTVASGGIPVTDNSALGYGIPVEEVTNGFGTAVTYVDSGGLAVLGGARGGTPVGPSAPVLALVGVVGNAVTFSYDLPSPVAGDTIRTMVRASGATDWLTLLYDNTHTITQTEIDSGTLGLTAAGLANGNDEASAIFHHVTDSGRSNVVPFTIAVVSANHRVSSAGNARVSSAGNNRIFA